MDDPDSLTSLYLRMLCRISKQLLSICNLIVSDAYFSKESSVRPATKRRWHLPSTHPCLLSTSPGLMPGSKGTPFRSMQPKPCYITLQCRIDLLKCPRNMRTCDQIKLISKNSYSTVFAPWRKNYKTNELLLKRSRH